MKTDNLRSHRSYGDDDDNQGGWFSDINLFELLIWRTVLCNENLRVRLDIARLLLLMVVVLSMIFIFMGWVIEFKFYLKRSEHK